MNDKPTSFGERLKAARLRAGYLLPQDLGRAMGASKQAVWDWETNNRIPRLKKLETLAKVLGVTVEHLRDGTPLPDNVALVPVNRDLKREIAETVQRLKELYAEDQRVTLSKVAIKAEVTF